MISSAGATSSSRRRGSASSSRVRGARRSSGCRRARRPRVATAAHSVHSASRAKLQREGAQAGRGTPTRRRPLLVRVAGPRRRSRGSGTGAGLASLMRAPRRSAPRAPRWRTHSPVVALGLEARAAPARRSRAAPSAVTLSPRSLRPKPARRSAEAAAEVHLEALDLLAVGVGDQLALEADVGDLDAGAGVRAAVDVDGDRRVEVGQPALQLARSGRRPRALVSTIASLQNSMPVQAIGAAPERRRARPAGRSRRARRRARRPASAGDVEDDQLLLRR